MEEVGRFVEIVSIQENEVEIAREVLEKILDGPETRNCQVAIISVLGPVRSHKSKLAGKMLQHLLEEDDNDSDLDEETDNQILNFGDDENLNTPSIVVWSKPFFVTKGARQKVAIFLMDIKGKFTDSNDKNYILLSGLCTFISSSVLYISNGRFDDSSMKHIESIALEGVRHLGTKQSIIFQKIRVIVENWNSIHEYNYGVVDADNFTTKLAETKNNPIFSSFAQFEFFFLPNENHDKYSHYFEKLLTTTLDSIYIVPRKLGSFIKSPVIIAELRKYVDAMDPDEEFNGSLRDFFPSKKPDTQSEEVTSENQTVPVKDKENANLFCTVKPRKNKKSPKVEHDASALKERRSSLRSQNIKEIQKDETKKPKSITPINALAEVVDTRKSNIDLSNENKDRHIEISNNQEEGKYPIENLQPKNAIVPNVCSIDSEEKFDLSTFMNLKNSPLEMEKYEEVMQGSSEPLLTPLQILERISQTKLATEMPDTVIHQREKDISTSITTSTKLLEKNENTVASRLSERNAITEISLIPENNSISETSPLPERNSSLSEISQIPERNATEWVTKFSNNKVYKKIVEFPCKDTNTSSAIKVKCTMIAPNLTSEVFSIKKTDDPAQHPKMRFENIKREGYLRNQVELHVIGAFNKVSLQSKVSIDDILQNVNVAIRKNVPNSKEVVENERSTVCQAITAILLYIEGMEKAFKDTFNFSQPEFEKLHEFCYKKAMESLENSTYLKRAVDTKIKEAKRVFHTFNHNYLLQQQTFITNAIKGVMDIYAEKMKANVSMDEDLLQKKHEEVMGSIMRVASMSCDINKSAWSKNVLGLLEKELRRQLEHEKQLRVKQKISKEKIANAVASSVFYYKNEINRTLRSGVVNELAQYNSLHETKYSDAIEKFKTLTERESRDIVLNGEKQLKLELEEQINTLRGDFIKKQNTIQTRRLDSPKQEVKPTFPQNVPKIQNAYCDDSFPNRCIAIHLDFSEIVACYLSKNETVEIYKKKDPYIGYNGRIFMQEGKSLLDNVSEYPLGRYLVSLKYIFQSVVIGDLITVNWNGVKQFRTEELLSFFLFQIKIDCEKILGGNICVCTVAVPSYFHAVESQAIRDAAVLAGFQTVQLLREVCVAAIGTWYFKDDNDKIPKDFILVNTLGEKWDAGYYNLNYSFCPNMLSGDTYTNKKLWNRFESTQTRFKNIIDNIIKQVPDSRKINVVILGAHALFSDLATNVQHKGTRITFFRARKSSINRGGAFVSALIGNDSNAQILWDKSHPVSSMRKCYHFDTILNNPWTAPINSHKSDHQTKGKNLDPAQIIEIKRKLNDYLTTPETVSNDAKSFLLTVEKHISDESFNSDARENIRVLISKTYTLIQNKGSPQDIETAIESVTRAYDSWKSSTS